MMGCQCVCHALFYHYTLVQYILRNNLIYHHMMGLLMLGAVYRTLPSRYELVINLKLLSTTAVCGISVDPEEEICNCKFLLTQRDRPIQYTLQKERN